MLVLHIVSCSLLRMISNAYSIAFQRYRWTNLLPFVEVENWQVHHSTRIAQISHQSQLQLKYWWSETFEQWTKTPAYQHIQRGAKWFRYRVSIHHPLGFNWHPFESAGIWGWNTSQFCRDIYGIIMNHYSWIPINPPGFKGFLIWQIRGNPVRETSQGPLNGFWH